MKLLIKLLTTKNNFNIVVTNNATSKIIKSYFSIKRLIFWILTINLFFFGSTYLIFSIQNHIKHKIHSIRLNNDSISSLNNGIIQQVKYIQQAASELKPHGEKPAVSQSDDERNNLLLTGAAH